MEDSMPMDVEFTEETVNKIEMLSRRARNAAERGSPAIPAFSTEDKSEHSLVLVVDTNVLLAHLDYLTSVAAASYQGIHVSLLVPWAVVRELDSLKGVKETSDRDQKDVPLGLLARRAIRFLDDHTSAHSAAVRVQKIEQTKIHLAHFTPDTNDDRILHCCFVGAMLAGPFARIVLLTNDRVLKVKANSQRITALDHHLFPTADSAAMTSLFCSANAIVSGAPVSPANTTSTSTSSSSTTHPSSSSSSSSSSSASAAAAAITAAASAACARSSFNPVPMPSTPPTSRRAPASPRPRSPRSSPRSSPVPLRGELRAGSSVLRMEARPAVARAPDESDTGAVTTWCMCSKEPSLHPWHGNAPPSKS